MNSDFSTGTSITANTLIVFDVNGWSNVVHLATGLIGLYMATEVVKARMYAMAMAGFYLVLAVWGLFTSTILSAIPINGADTVLHAAIGAIALMVVLSPDRSET